MKDESWCTVKVTRSGSKVLLIVQRGLLVWTQPMASLFHYPSSYLHFLLYFSLPSIHILDVVGEVRVSWGTGFRSWYSVLAVNQLLGSPLHNIALLRPQ